MLWTPGQILQTRPLRIESTLAQNGFSLTYQATHLQLNHQVVLKTPNVSLQNDPEYANFVGRFIREGQMLAQFCQNAHPGIVRISDWFEEKGLHCLVMDLIIGQSLFDAVQQRGRLPDTEAVTIIRQIGEALIDVHQAGIVHRDVHPGNIMLRPNEQAVLIDFGIASELWPMVSTRILPKSLSRTGKMPVPQELWEMSTSKHCSHRDFAPWEQQMEGSGEPTVDIYALAASLYYAVTGRVPTPSVKRKFENAVLPPAKDFGVKDWVSLVIEKGMESEPQKRPPSMQDWLNHLQEKPTISSVSVQLKSARGVDYTRLRDLLVAGEWQEADLETRNVMLKAARREQEGDLDLDSIESFPCDDLRTIDQLWQKYSYGRFGFSVQKKIWLSVGGKVDYKTECKLGDRVGWRKGSGKGGSWLNYSDLTFNKTAPRGHLPCWFGLWGVAEHFWCRVHSCLASRASSCNL